MTMTDSETATQTTTRRAINHAVLRTALYYETEVLRATVIVVKKTPRSAGDAGGARKGGRNATDAAGYTNMFPNVDSEWRVLLLPPTR